MTTLKFGATYSGEYAMFALKPAVAFVVFVMAAGPAGAGTTEEEVYAAFETFCLSHINELDQIANLLADAGAIQLPPERAEAEGFAHPRKGTAWVVKGTESEVVITATHNGVCKTSAPKADGKETIKLIEKHLRHKKLASEIVGGIELRVAYAVTIPNSNVGAQHVLVHLAVSEFIGVEIMAMAETHWGASVPASDWP